MMASHGGHFDVSNRKRSCRSARAALARASRNIADPKQPGRAAKSSEPQPTTPLQNPLVKATPLTHSWLSAPPSPPLVSFLGLRSLSSTLSFLASDFFLAGIFYFGCGLRGWHRPRVMAINLPVKEKCAGPARFLIGRAHQHRSQRSNKKGFA